MADGRLELTQSQVIARATDLKNCAVEMEELLRLVKTEMQQINDQGSKVYFGSKNPVLLSQELERFSSMFYLVYEQILTESNKLATIANTVSNE
jgi:hypothetical protein